MVIKSAIILTFLLSSISALPIFTNSLLTCLVNECSFRQANSDYSKSLLKCSENILNCFNSFQVSNCLQSCDTYFNEADSQCNQKCIEKNSGDIQKSCKTEPKPEQKKADTHYFDKENYYDEESNDTIIIVIYCLIGLILGMVIAGFICYFMRKQRRQQIQQQKNYNDQSNKANASHIVNISQEIALGYPVNDNVFYDKNNNIYFVGDFSKIQPTQSIQDSQAFMKQNFILEKATQSTSNQYILSQQTSLPEHLQKYNKNNLPIKSAVIGENQDQYNQLHIIIPQGTKL